MLFSKSVDHSSSA